MILQHRRRERLCRGPVQGYLDCSRCRLKRKALKWPHRDAATHAVASSACTKGCRQVHVTNQDLMHISSTGLAEVSTPLSLPELGLQTIQGAVGSTAVSAYFSCFSTIDKLNHDNQMTKLESLDYAS